MEANQQCPRFMPVSANSPYLLAAIALCIMALMPCLAHADLKRPCVASADDRARIALISAFSDEATAYVEQMQRNDAANQFQGCAVINGYRFVKGQLRGQGVVVVLSNSSIVNAAMVTQLTLDRFRVTHVIFSGISGGIGGLGANDDDPKTPNETPLGSVAIPRRWGFHQEMFFNDVRQTVPCAFSAGLQLSHVLQPARAEAQTCQFQAGTAPQPGKADPTSVFMPDAKHAFLRTTNVTSEGTPQFYVDAQGKQQLRRVPFPGGPVNLSTDQDLKFWFAVDEAMFRMASGLQVTLVDCRQDEAGQCILPRLLPPPRLIVGDNGISGPTFLDNTDYRRWVATMLNFDEQGRRNNQTDVLVADMETAAAAMVAYSNRIPFIGVRAVSDLAGGAADTKQLQTFFAIAAENQSRVVLALLDALRGGGTAR